MPTLSEALDAIKAELPPGADFTWERRDGAVFLDRLFIPEESRGIGTGVVAKILAEIDRAGLAATLYADPTDEPGDPDTFELARFYARFGFRLDHLNDQEWVGMRREPQPYRGGYLHVMADYAVAKATGDMARDDFEAWRAAESEKPYAAPLPGPRL